jgi:hypothetical protein
MSRRLHAATAEARRPRDGGAAATERFEMTLDGLRQLHRRLDHQQLEAHDWPFLRALVSKQIARAEGRQQRMLTKLDATAAAGAAQDGDGAKATETSAAIDNNGPQTPGDSEAPPNPSAKTKGHGRNGVDAYSQARHFFYGLSVGALCEACGLGRMNRYREKIIIRILGQPLFFAEVHHHEQARCRNCGRLVRADGPVNLEDGIGTEHVRYDWSACAMLLVMHYFAGAPFKRLESLHRGWGVPLPDANQWQVVNAADDLLFPLYKALEAHAIQKATNFRIDDTGSMVIALKRKIDAEIVELGRLGESSRDVRTGINATGSYWETPNGPVLLFYTGRHHAGEIVDQLLWRRLHTSPKLVKVTDGASKNFDHEQGEKVIEATCNAHAFLKFCAVRDKHPAEYAEAGSVYQQVFDNDDAAKARGLSPLERMLYHRQNSKPLMERLKKMCEERIKSRRVEPSSPLWEPLTFIVNQWARLTRFCEVPDVPLDTNIIEQALIMPVRYLAGSFNYQSEDGATVGDHAMSLIATARAQGVEPVAYLTECLRCHADLAERPDHYLPWVYRERLAAQGPPDAGRPEPEPLVVQRGEAP